MTDALKADILAGAYWLIGPADDAEVAIVACGAVVPEAIEAHAQLTQDIPGAGLMIVTSPDRLEGGWRASIAGRTTSHIEGLLKTVPRAAGLITVADAHPATLSWIGAVGRHRLIPLGVDRFGQSGDIPDLYHAYGIDADAIITAAARLVSEPVSVQWRPRPRSSRPSSGPAAG
jgi:pyruvate dehydrogenase E1 component